MLKSTPRVLQIVRGGAGNYLSPESMLLTTLFYHLLVLERARVERTQAVSCDCRSQNSPRELD